MAANCSFRPKTALIVPDLNRCSFSFHTNRMEATPGQLYKVRLRVENKIYKTTLLGHLVDDLQLWGIRSSVLHQLKDNEVTGCVVGSFRHPIEIMYIEPVEKPQAMEIEQVSVIYLKLCQSIKLKKEQINSEMLIFSFVLDIEYYIWKW